MNFPVVKTLLASCLVLVSCASPQPLATVGQVDLARYAGHWFEMMRLPNSFQKDDSRATADYTV